MPLPLVVHFAYGDIDQISILLPPLSPTWIIAQAQSCSQISSQACIVLGAAVVVLAPEKYNSNCSAAVLEWRVK
jgi:hypothetical protein